MRGLGLIFLAVTCSTAAMAQLSLQDPSLSSYNKCLNEAIQDNALRKIGAQTSYSCYAATARSWYETLTGDKEVRDKNGLFVARYYGDSGYCAHQIEDGAGKPVSAYVCEIVTSTPN